VPRRDGNSTPFELTKSSAISKLQLSISLTYAIWRARGAVAIEE